MKKLSLNKKISLVILMFVLGLVAVSAMGIRSLGSIYASLAVITDENSPRIVNSNMVRAHFRNNAILLLNAIIEENPEARAKTEKRLEDAHAEYHVFLEGVIGKSSVVARPKYEKVKELYGQWQNAAVKVLAARAADRPVNQIYEENKRLRAEAETLLAEVVAYNLRQMEESKASAGELYSHSRSLMVALGALVTLLASALAFAVLSATSRRINAVILSLREGSIQVSSAAQQIASSSEEISQAATEQAASLEETAASIEEMNSMIAKNSENAGAAASTSIQSQTVVKEGKGVVEEMIHSMGSINRNSESMNEIMKVIEDIGAKTKVINDIVFQTKLLSFNASVEAARAGEHGKGFAVVAEEVGNLAQMSGNAAQEIGTLLEESTDKVQRIIQETKTNVEAGSRIAHRCGEVFDRVVENVEKVSEMAAEISSASDEQARGCAEVTKAMAQVDQATQQNSATSEECASASEQLASQAEVLESTVGELVSTILGAGATVAAQGPAESRKKSARPGASENVIHLKAGGSKTPPRTASMPLKKAAGAPDYDSAGFEDV